MQHLTMDLANQNVKLYYYRQTYFSPEKLSHIRVKLDKAGKEVMYYSKCFNHNYVDCFSYETCKKIIFTSGEDLLKQGMPKSNINKISPS